MTKIKVQNTDVTIIKVDEIDYISLTDIAKHKTTDTNVVIAYGKYHITQILNPSNSRGLEKKQA